MREKEETEPSTLGYLPKYKEGTINPEEEGLLKDRIYKVGIAKVPYYK